MMAYGCNYVLVRNIGTKWIVIVNAKNIFCTFFLYLSHEPNEPAPSRKRAELVRYFREPKQSDPSRALIMQI